jgi:hypothetical protein
MNSGCERRVLLETNVITVRAIILFVSQKKKKNVPGTIAQNRTDKTLNSSNLTQIKKQQVIYKQVNNKTKYHVFSRRCSNHDYQEIRAS